MKEKIESISEAFSTEPVFLKVGSGGIKEIKKEKVTEWIAGDPFDYDFYVGYDESGDKMFQYRAIACNVHFQKQL